MRTLIIGGTGNISTATARILADRGEDVTLYNRGRTGAPAGCKTIIGDRYDHAAFEAQVAEAGTFDCVIDMIGYDPEDVRSLVRAFSGRTEHLIFCSTVDVYTKPAKVYPIVESAERAPSPAFPYAYKKALCEHILEDAHAGGDFAVTIIRPAHTYQDSGSPIPLIGGGTHFFKRIRQGKPIIVLGDGTSFWGSAHRDDVGATFAVAAGKRETYGKAYHVTAEEIFTWEQLYQTVADVMGAPPISFVHIPTDLLGRIAPKAAAWSVVNFHYNNIFDNSAARVDLDYRYTIPWAEGVRRMIAWHDARGDVDSSPDDPLYNKIVDVWRTLGESAVREMASLDA
ncbi:MAG: NAD-dependent epimerase/dehydratase family protein [Anaerolineae bacterium]|nr:NAD-dependent epimerase/dehydratase family protein [Anaerolineae bacterium]